MARVWTDLAGATGAGQVAGPNTVTYTYDHHHRKELPMSEPTTTPAAFLAMDPFAVNEMCGDAEGSAIGLPTVPADRFDATVERARLWFTSHDAWQCGHVVCRIARSSKTGAVVGDECTECGVAEHAMSADDLSFHQIAGGFVMVGCEGFHLAAFRAVYWLGDGINDAVAALDDDPADETDVEPDDYFDADALLDAIEPTGLAAWVFEPGPGTVQIDTDDAGMGPGCVFICDPDGGSVGGGYVVGFRPADGGDETTVWSGDDMAAAVGVAVAAVAVGVERVAESAAQSGGVA